MENTSSIVLREVMMSDLPIFFDQQLDPEANWMAAFTRKDPADRDAFMAHWTKILENEATTNQTILFNGSVAGSVSSYVDEDEHLEVTYWIGKPYWGKGIATCALSAFLSTTRYVLCTLVPLKTTLALCASWKNADLRGSAKAEDFPRRAVKRWKSSFFAWIKGGETAFPALLHGMKHPLAEQGKAGSAIHCARDRVSIWSHALQPCHC